jgi:hypothetical protein
MLLLMSNNIPESEYRSVQAVVNSPSRIDSAPSRWALMIRLGGAQLGFVGLSFNRQIAAVTPWSLARQGAVHHRA